MAQLSGHLPPIKSMTLTHPSAGRRPRLTPQWDWIQREMKMQRLIHRSLFLNTTAFRILSRYTKGGPAELLRMIFRFGHIPFKNIVITRADWKALLLKTPHGNLPALWIDHKMYGEPNAVVRHLASHMGLLGRSMTENVKVEAALAQVEEMRDSNTIQKAFQELTENRVDDSAELLLEVMIPRNFSHWESQMRRTGGPYLLGSTISVADMAIYDFLKQHVNHLPFEKEIVKYPCLERMFRMDPLHPRIEVEPPPFTDAHMSDSQLSQFLHEKVKTEKLLAEAVPEY